MQKVFQVDGMTCQGCRAHVEAALHKLEAVKNAQVSLEKENAEIEFQHEVSVAQLQVAIGENYTISIANQFLEKAKPVQEIETSKEPSKLKQLQPLFLIFFYITTASFLLHFSDFSISNWMYDFMGLFFIVFSFFKFLDYKGFPASFKMYDPLAKVFPPYAWMYPFLESLLGLCFLFRFQLDVVLIVTLLVLGITTIGVSQSLFSNRKIKCACLGTALNLPMTEATFIENTIMITMSIILLIY